MAGTRRVRPWRPRCRRKRRWCRARSSVHMFGLRLITDCNAAHEERQPAQRTTGADSTSSTQLCVATSKTCSRWPSIASAATASVSGRVHQKRRRKSTSSGLSSSVEARHLGLERHAALRAGARMVLPDLGVHRAGVDRAATGSGRQFRLPARAPMRRAAVRLQVLRRIGRELRLAACAAEVDGRALVLHRVWRTRRDGHAAHGIRQRVLVQVCSAAIRMCRNQNGPALGAGPSIPWSGRRDSNSRPLAPHASALPGCATPRGVGL